MPVTTTPQDCNKRGQELALYYNVGDDTTQVWVEHVGLVGDLNLSETEELSQHSARSSTREVNEYIEGEIELGISGTQFVDVNYEGFIFLQGMRRGGEARDVMVLTGLISEVGSQGWRGMMRNSDRSIAGPESGPMAQSFNLQPAACTTVKVRPVRIASADTVSDFDPTSFSTVST